MLKWITTPHQSPTIPIRPNNKNSQENTSPQTYGTTWKLQILSQNLKISLRIALKTIKAVKTKHKKMERVKYKTLMMLSVPQIIHQRYLDTNKERKKLTHFRSSKMMNLKRSSRWNTLKIKISRLMRCKILSNHLEQQYLPWTTRSHPKRIKATVKTTCRIRLTLKLNLRIRNQRMILILFNTPVIKKNLKLMMIKSLKSLRSKSNFLK